MNKVIIYKDSAGNVEITKPAPIMLLTYTLHEIAERVVPAGMPYAIIDADSIPANRTERDNWSVDDADLVDGTGKHQIGGS